MLTKLLCQLGFHKWPAEREVWLMGAHKWTYRKFCGRKGCGAMKTEVEPVPRWMQQHMFNRCFR